LLSDAMDIRHVIKTILNVPESFEKHITVLINNQESYPTARNLITLLLCLIYGNGEAADFITHFWYSSSLKGEESRPLVKNISSLVKEGRSKPEEESADPDLTRVQVYRTSSCSTVVASLFNEEWREIYDILDFRPSLRHDEAEARRIVATQSSPALDFCRKVMFSSSPPAHHVVDRKYLDTGILLPYGESTDGFDVPNP